jgi:membrane protease YdiL (CAAX protease family)
MEVNTGDKVFLITLAIICLSSPLYLVIKPQSDFTKYYSILSFLLIIIVFLYTFYNVFHGKKFTLFNLKLMLDEIFEFIGLNKMELKQLYGILLLFSLAIYVVYFTVPLMFQVSILFLYAILLAPIAEEIVFRGFIISKLMDIFKNENKWIVGAGATICSSLIFTFMHEGSLPPRFLTGLLLGSIYLFKWRKNLFYSITAHTLLNAYTVIFIVAPTLP